MRKVGPSTNREKPGRNPYENAFLQKMKLERMITYFFLWVEAPEAWRPGAILEQNVM